MNQLQLPKSAIKDEDSRADTIGCTEALLARFAEASTTARSLPIAKQQLREKLSGLSPGVAEK